MAIFQSFTCNANECVLLTCLVSTPPQFKFPQLFPGSILLPPVNGVDAPGTRQYAHSMHAAEAITTAGGAFIIHFTSNSSTKTGKNYTQQPQISAQCRHIVRPSAQSCIYILTLIFDLLTEKKWHTGYSSLVERSHKFRVFYVFFCFRVRSPHGTDRQTDRQTDGRAGETRNTPSSMHKSSDEMLVTTDKVQVLEADKNVQIKTRQMSPLN